MQEEPNEKLTYMTDLQKLVNKLNNEGYTEQFKVEKNALRSLTSGLDYQPHDVKAVNFYRFEGPSDPEDMSICYVIETHDGHKGTLIDAYGVYADEETGEFMQSVEIFKKTHRTHDDSPKSNSPDHHDMLPEDVLNKEQDPESVRDPLQMETQKSTRMNA